mgnify:CR=1 FL=1
MSVTLSRQPYAKKVRFKVAIAVSHPIQHFAPQFRSWSRRPDVDLLVLYASSAGAVEHYDPGFAAPVRWDQSVLAGYPFELLDGHREEPAPLSAMLDAPSITRHLSVFDPDIVVTYGYAHRFAHRVRRWGIGHRKHLAYVSDSENRHREGARRSLLKRLAVRRYLKPFSSVWTVGDANEEYYLDLGLSTQVLHRMRFPIDVDLFTRTWRSKEQVRSNYRRRLGLADDEVAVLVVGKLIARKRHIDALQACLRIGSEMKVRLIVVGSGPEESSLMTAAKQFEHRGPIFAGFVDPNDLPGFYAASDVYLHPSNHDPHPLAVSEAIFMGLPVLVSDRTGSWGDSDDVIPGHNGFVFQCGDVDSLKSRIVALAESPNRRRTFAMNSRALGVAYQRHSHHTFLDHFLLQFS